MRKRIVFPGLLLLVVFLCSCAGLQAKKTTEDDFRAFPDTFAARAGDLEKKGELREALAQWKIVAAFKPGDPGAARKIGQIEKAILQQTKLHYKRGEDFLKQNDPDKAKKEFLLTLAYDPANEGALRRIRELSREEHFETYTVKPGDTVESIAAKVYRQGESAVLIQYFNDLPKGGTVTPGMTLRLPKLQVAPPVEEASEVPPEERESISREDEYDDLLLKATCLYNDGKYGEARTCFAMVLKEDAGNAEASSFLKRMVTEAETHYRNGVKYFINEKMDLAIAEWEQTIALNPNHAEARRDMEKARDILKKLKQIQ
jgi:tetratricopeptide (TPR) repeat protein